MSLWNRFVQKCELPQPAGITKEELYLSNGDLKPVVKEKRTWGSWTYALLWFGEEANVVVWTIASTGVTSGLAWWEAWLCVILGQSFNSIFITANGRPGAVYHVGFPVITRASFGVWGSYWPIFNRNVMTVIWCGVQLVTAGNCFYVMLHAIFPSIDKVGNPFGPDVTMTGGRLIGFVIAWVANISCTYFEIHKLRRLIIVKSAVMMICLLAFFGWTCHLAGGVGPIVHQGSSIPEGKSKGWTFVQVLFIMAANEVTFSLNASDMSRYATKPNDALWPPFICHPIATTIISLFGILVTSSSSVVLGELIWDPNTILDRYLLLDYNAKNRAGVFFIALGFGFAQVTSNVLANMISAGNDTAAMFPRFINIRRGAIVVISLSFIINPWQLSKSSFAFTNYLGSYQIFLSSILGVVLCDYYFVKKGYMNVEDLFRASPNSLYYYHAGWNWRAYVAYVCGIIPNFPGFLDSVGVKGIPVAAVRLYYLALPVGIVVAAAVYYPLNLWKPPPGGIAERWNEEIELSYEAEHIAEYGGSGIEGVVVEHLSKGVVEKV